MCIFIQKILKVNVQWKPEIIIIILRLMNNQIERSYGTLLYMIIAATFLYAQRWRDLQLPAWEE